MTTTIRAKKIAFTLDCPDAKALAEFYGGMLGWRLDYDPEDAEWVDLVPPEGEGAGIELGFQTVPDYRAPEWPEGVVPQQGHLDLYVESLEDAGELAVSLGARRHEVQPSVTGSFVVYLDPVGHPFCLCRAD